MAHKNPVEVVLLVSRNDCDIEEKLKNTDCTVERISFRSDKALHRIRPAGTCDVWEMFTSKGIKAISTKKGEIWAEGKNCKLCSLLTSMEFLKISSAVFKNDDNLLLRLIVPTLGYARALKAKLENLNFEYKILDILPLNSQEMTLKERKVLETAINSNYFECDDRTSLTQLANSIGVSPSSLSEMLRRSTKKAVVFYLRNRTFSIPIVATSLLLGYFTLLAHGLSVLL